VFKTNKTSDEQQILTGCFRIFLRVKGTYFRWFPSEEPFNIDWHQ